MNDNANDSPSLDVVQISCSGCGACCREMVTPPMYVALLINPAWLGDDEDSQRVRELPDDLRHELLDDFERRRICDHAGRRYVCLWFDEATKGCKHYELRPSICREFEMGSEECHGWRREYGIA